MASRKMTSKKIGEKIRKARKMAGLSQRKLASIVGVCDSLICRYENGSRLPPLHVLGNLSKALGCQLNDL